MNLKSISKYLHSYKYINPQMNFKDANKFYTELHKMQQYFFNRFFEQQQIKGKTKASQEIEYKLYLEIKQLKFIIDTIYFSKSNYLFDSKRELSLVLGDHNIKDYKAQMKKWRLIKNEKK